MLRQTRPYPPLTEATEHEPITEFTDLAGTVVGFRTPDYAQGISVTGYHLHVIETRAPAAGTSSTSRSTRASSRSAPARSSTSGCPRTTTVIAGAGSAAQDADIRRAEG